MAMHSYGKAPAKWRTKETDATVRRPHPIFGEINIAAETGWGCGEFLKQTPQQYT